MAININTINNNNFLIPKVTPTKEDYLMNLVLMPQSYHSFIEQIRMALKHIVLSLNWIIRNYLNKITKIITIRLLKDNQKLCGRALISTLTLPFESIKQFTN